MYRSTRRRLQALTACITLVTVALGMPRASQAQTAERCFPETGFCISGPIRAYWEGNGGLPVFGFPIAPLHTETIEGTWSGPTQWFERDRLEDHTNEGQGVLAGRLGALYLEQTGRPWQRGNDGPRPGAALCTMFDQTGYNVCSPFSYEWRNNGGLARFGYPITPAFEEEIEGRRYLVQYFERRRMELHSELPERVNSVLLGLLGQAVLENRTANVCQISVPSPLLRVVTAYRPSLGCPTALIHVAVAGALQLFERGWMAWIGPTGSEPPTLVAVYANEGDSRWRWQSFLDTYQEGEPVGTGELPPPNRLAPTRGFGKLWRNNAEIRGALGWAVDGEEGQPITTLVYPDGAQMIYLHDANRAFVLLSSGLAATEQP